MEGMYIPIISGPGECAAGLMRILDGLGFTMRHYMEWQDAISDISEGYSDIFFCEEALALQYPEMIWKIKQEDSGIYLAVFAGSGDAHALIELLRAGANDYLPKEFSIDDLKALMLRFSGKDNGERKEVVEAGLVSNILSSRSDSMQDVIRMAKKVAPTKATVLINGETGTGKGQLAQVLHELSPCRRKPFIKVNCAAIPETLLESELFGYEKGAFTGAVREKPGRFELADDSTIFLDEIGDISPVIQVKLLRVLQEKEFERLGGIETLKADVRIITATNKNLQVMVREGKFREDLYYRLNVVPVIMPPLRERKEDIPDLTARFLQQFSYHTDGRVKKIEESAVKKLIRYNWPGNIRELENVIENCVVVSEGWAIRVKDLPVCIREYGKNECVSDGDQKGLGDAVQITERKAVQDALQEFSGNRTLAARKLGISVRSLQRKIAKYLAEDGKQDL